MVPLSPLIFLFFDSENKISIKSGLGTGKNYLALLKLKFLFLALLLCSIETQKTASVFSFLFTNNVLTISVKLHSGGGSRKLKGQITKMDKTTFKMFCRNQYHKLNNLQIQIPNK